jgi:hypothetical protein
LASTSSASSDARSWYIPRANYATNRGKASDVGRDIGCELHREPNHERLFATTTSEMTAKRGRAEQRFTSAALLELYCKLLEPGNAVDILGNHLAFAPVGKQVVTLVIPGEQMRYSSSYQ